MINQTASIALLLIYYYRRNHFFVGLSDQNIIELSILINFFCIFLAGLSVWPLLCLCRQILYYLEMSGFEPRELPQQAGALPT